MAAAKEISTPAMTACEMLFFIFKCGSLKLFRSELYQDYTEVEGQATVMWTVQSLRGMVITLDYL